MKRNVSICDDCEKVVAVYKCRYCGKDLCEGHTSDIYIELLANTYDKDNFQQLKICIGKPYNREGEQKCYLCYECVAKFKEQMKILDKAFQNDKDISFERGLVDDLLEVIKNHVKVEVI
jgi:DNA-directed RNA polymerase subunit RPC12/RpoP